MMKQKLLPLILLLLLFSSTMYSAQSNLGLESGYHSNVAEEQNGKGSAYINSFYNFSSAFLSGDKSVFFLVGSLKAQKYLQTQEEDFAKAAIQGTWRLKGNSSAFDLNLFAYHENLWNSSDSTFFNVGLNPVLREDFGDFSLYFGARGGKFIFPDEEMDRYYAGPELSGAFDFSWRVVLKMKFNYLYEWFDEKKILTSTLAKTDEAMYRQIFGTALSLNYFISPVWNFSAGLAFQIHDSNGNDYDEQISYLYPDYFSKQVYLGNISLSYRNPDLEWKTNFMAGYEDYKNRYPLSTFTTPDSSKSLYITSFKLESTVKYFITKSFYINLGGSYEMRSSNDVQEDISFYAVNGGLGLSF